MNSEEFRKKLVELVKASGQEVIDRAEELVGEGELITDFDIWLRFPLGETSIVTSIPTIEVSKSYVSRNSFNVLANKGERYEKKNYYNIETVD